jgi:hypothetical protein
MQGGRFFISLRGQNMNIKNLALFAAALFTSNAWSYTTLDYIGFCLLGKDSAGRANARYQRGRLETPHIEATDRTALSVYCTGKLAEDFFKNMLNTGYKVTRREWTAGNIVDTIRFNEFRSSACYYSVTKNKYYCYVNLSAHRGLVGAFTRVARTDPRRLDTVEKSILNARNALAQCLSSQTAFLKSEGNVFERHLALGCRSTSLLPGSRPDLSLAARAYNAMALLGDRSTIPNLEGIPVVKKVSATKYVFGNRDWPFYSFCEQSQNTYTCALQADL